MSAITPWQESRSVRRIGDIEISLPNRTSQLIFTSSNPEPQVGLIGGLSINVNLLDGSATVERLPGEDPSTIFTTLAVRRPHDLSEIPRPKYYPSYAGLTPEQRWVFLKWLEDIGQPIDIGYVFVYYYGLERHLLLGDYASAFDEILYLRRVHGTQQAFDNYSRIALLNASVVRQDERRLKQLYELAPPPRFHDTDLMLAHRMGQDLGVEGLLHMAYAIPSVNKRYIRSHPDVYRQSLSQALVDDYGTPYLPFASAYSIDELPRVPQMLFANTSFPDRIRTPVLPSFSQHEPLIEAVSAVLASAHARSKQLLAAARKQRHM